MTFCTCPIQYYPLVIEYSTTVSRSLVPGAPSYARRVTWNLEPSFIVGRSSVLHELRSQPHFSSNVNIKITYSILRSCFRSQPSWLSLLLLIHTVVLFNVDGVFSMRIVVQRVKSASVTVDGEIVSQIGPGILALVGIHEHDATEDVQYCARRLLGAKLWENEETGGAWRHGVKTKGYQILCVSQFTLYGTLTNKKWQPDYKLAMKSIPAQSLYDEFLEKLRQDYEVEGKIYDGKFGAMMDVALVNDGPVTIVIDSDPKPPTEGIDPKENSEAS